MSGLIAQTFGKLHTFTDRRIRACCTEDVLTSVMFVQKSWGAVSIWLVFWHTAAEVSFIQVSSCPGKWVLDFWTMSKQWCNELYSCVSLSKLSFLWSSTFPSFVFPLARLEAASPETWHEKSTTVLCGRKRLEGGMSNASLPSLCQGTWWHNYCHSGTWG